MTSVSLKKWFFSNARQPLAIAAFLFFAIQITSAAFVISRTKDHWRATSERVAQTVSLGIKQENRDLIESAFSALKYDLNLKSIVLCKQGRSILALPPQQTCRTQPSGWREFTISKTLSGSNEHEIQISFDLLGAISPTMQLLGMTLLFYVVAILILIRAQNALRKDLLIPLGLSIDDDASSRRLVASIKIKELRDLFENQIEKIAAYKKVSAENMINERKAAIADVVQMVAHDVRKPFSLIQMLLELIRTAENPEELKQIITQFAPEVQGATASVNGMLQDLLAVDGEMHLIRETCDIGALASKCFHELSRIHPQWKGTLQCDFRHSSTVSADATKIHRVFSNIMSNAMEASRQGDLMLSTKETDGEIKISIQNTGSYIPKESLPKIFERFFTSGKKSGTGLGLAIAKRIVSIHEGTIACASEKNQDYPTGMVRFDISLPLTGISQ